MPYANNKGADQLVHLRSLISIFVVRCLDSIIPQVSVSEISSLYLASVAVQAGLCLTGRKPTKTGFLVTRLIWDIRSILWRETDKVGNSYNFLQLSIKTYVVGIYYNSNVYPQHDFMEIWKNIKYAPISGPDHGKTCPIIQAICEQQKLRSACWFLFT